MNKFIKSILIIILISFAHYITMEILNEKKFFDFSDSNTIERLILSLIVGIIIELSIKYKNNS